MQDLHRAGHRHGAPDALDAARHGQRAAAVLDGQPRPGERDPGEPQPDRRGGPAELRAAHHAQGARGVQGRVARPEATAPDLRVRGAEDRGAARPEGE